MAGDNAVTEPLRCSLDDVTEEEIEQLEGTGSAVSRYIARLEDPPRKQSNGKPVTASDLRTLLSKKEMPNTEHKYTPRAIHIMKLLNTKALQTIRQNVSRQYGLWSFVCAEANAGNRMA